jgi:hypothetical protein
MESIKKFLIWVFALLTLNLCLEPCRTKLYAAENKTKHPLEIRRTPEVEMKETVEQVRSNYWLLGLLGVAVIGGVAAVAGGVSGGGGGNGGGEEPTGGSIVGSW